jgi:DNA-directed RNA polymerase specialized sigma24 family protein
MVTIEGRTMCIADWADALNIDVDLVRSRLQRGWKEIEALGMTPKNTPARTSYIRSDARWVEHNGRRMILAEWCKELGIKSKTVYSRLMRGSTELEALGLS